MQVSFTSQGFFHHDLGHGSEMASWAGKYKGWESLVFFSWRGWGGASIMRTNMPPKDVFFSFSNRWDDMLESNLVQGISYHTDRHIYSHFVFTTVLF